MEKYSFLVERTESLRLVSSPIIKQVSELDRVINTKSTSSFPDVWQLAKKVRESVHILHRTIITETSPDEDLHNDALPMVCEMMVNASEQLVEAAGSLRQQPRSRQARGLFLGATQEIKATVIKVLLHWDDAEIGKILGAAQNAQDKLKLASGAQSLRSLVLCFRNYADAMKILLSLVDKRQKDLVNMEKKKKLLVSLNKMKAALPLFSRAMQSYVKSKTPQSKQVKESVSQNILVALNELVDSIKEHSGHTMARNILEVKRRLGNDKRYSIGSELDRHINAIIENSMAVAHVSQDEYREVILRECGEVLTLRKELSTHFETVSAAPGSARAKRAFDRCTEKLCERLNELDRLVADSVVEQVTEVFVEASAPINSLVHVATTTGSRKAVPTAVSSPLTSEPYAPPPTSRPSYGRRHDEPHLRAGTRTKHGGEEDDEEDTVDLAAGDDSGLTKQVNLFRRHSQRLSQVAAYAAQSSTDTERIQKIKELADGVDELTSRVVEKAEMVSKNPQDKRAKEELDLLRHKWANQVRELTRVIDDIIDPEDFMAQSEANIEQDMAKCKDAMQKKDWEELRRQVLAIAAKARRALEVSEAAVANAYDRTYKATLSTAVARLEKAIPKMVSMANKMLENVSRKDSRQQFVNSLKEVLGCLHEIRSVLGTEIDIPSEEEDDEERYNSPSPYQKSMPLQAHDDSSKSRTAEERMIGRNVKRVKTKGRYIGRLGPRNSEARSSYYDDESPRKRDYQTPSYGDEPDDGRRRADELYFTFSEDLNQSLSSSGTQTPRPHTIEQSSQVEQYYLSTNATMGSLPPTLSPSSSTTSWRTPMSPVPPLSPVRQAPLSPARYTPEKSPAKPTSPFAPESRVSHHPVPSSSPTKARTVRSYVSPLQKLISAAERGDDQLVSTFSSDLSARTIRLTEMADSAASTLKDAHLVRVIQTKSSEVNNLTPRLLRQADQVSKNPQQRRKKEEFQATTHLWAGHVRELINATQEANLPWSRTAEHLVRAVRTGEGLEEQMEHVSTQTRKMMDIATMTIEAAETEVAIGEDAVGGGGEGGGDPNLSADIDLHEQVQLVKTKMFEIKKLTPQLLGAAEMATGQPEESAASEHLNLLSHEWATKAKVLMKGVDEVTLGMGGAADTLLLSARSGDPGLLKEQTKALKNLAMSLQTIARDAIEGCPDAEKVKVVQVVGRNINKLSIQLVESADIMAEVMEERGEPDQDVQEDTELLRRDWSSQVHLLSAHIDGLTAETSAPFDRLVDLSLQANRTSGQARKYLLDKFEAKAAFITAQLVLVENLFGDATQDVSHFGLSLRNAEAALGFLKRLTPHAIGASKSLATDAGSAMLEHFNHLRRQWAAKSQFLLANLRKVDTADMEDVIESFMDLLHDSQGASPGGVEPPPDMSDQSSISSTSHTLSPMFHSYSSEVLGDISPRTRFEFDDEMDLKAPSTPTVVPRPKKKTQFPSLSEMGLKHVTPRVKRPTSMTIPLPSWAVGDATEDTNSSDSIELAAGLLRELTEEFLEENNPIVTVGKEMSKQMSQMAEFTRGKGELRNKMDLINTAKAVAANGQTIAKIANLISGQCVDIRSRSNLQCCAEMIPTLSTQLTILASVKTSTPDDISADVMLVKNAQNLMQAVIKTVQAAEAACMKGLRPTENDGILEGNDGRQETVNLAMTWKRKLYHQRAKESVHAPKGARGLRKLNKNRISTPSVVDVIKPSAANMKSPSKV